METEGPSATTWFQVKISVRAADDPGAADLAVDTLWSCGAAGVEERAQGGGIDLLGGFGDAAAAERAVVAARSVGLGATVAPIDDHGLDAWREFAQAERAGSFWITPPWVPAPTLTPGQRVLWIDPGRTFGSGSHPTTRLVLTLVPQFVTPETTVLDVGTGSGVLAVAAACCDARGVTATDIDPTSPEVVTANATRNGVAGRIRTTTERIEALARAGTRYDVVLANLLAPVIAEVGPSLVACVAPGGHLVVSGLLEDRWEASLPALAPLAVEQVCTEDGWVAAVLR